ncbi:hypothetical protein ABTX80_22415 [Streptomyces erythrochromogenes]
MIRSAEVVNEEIRRLWESDSLAVEDRDRYHRLVIEWDKARQAEQAQAA